MKFQFDGSQMTAAYLATRFPYGEDRIREALESGCVNSQTLVALMEGKRCRACQEHKSRELFGTARNKRGEEVPHSYCKACRSKVTIAFKAKARQGDVEPQGWPVPSMGLVESLDCVRLRKWCREVGPNALFGAASMGRAVA